jgi:DNA-binding Lrp family transcriptional regulator
LWPPILHWYLDAEQSNALYLESDHLFRNSLLQSESSEESGEMDETDRAILRELTLDGRIPNNALAARVGVAPSTALARVKSLVDQKVITNFTIDIDPGAMGAPVQAIVALQLRTHHKLQVLGFAERIARLPGVVQTFHVSGGEDFLVHVAVSDPESLRAFILDSLTSDPSVSHARTHLVFEHQRNRNS